MIFIDKEKNQQINAQNVWFEIRKTIDDGSELIENFVVMDAQIPKEYFINASTDSGYDIALLEIKDKNNFLKNIKHIQLGIYENEKDIKNISVIGFPGKINDKLSDLMYGMNGTIDITNKNKKLIQYNDIDTSEGQSGSIILYGNKRMKLFNDINENEIKIIGIHCGGSISFFGSLNWGTKINKQKFNWINKKILYSKNKSNYNFISYPPTLKQLIDDEIVYDCTCDELITDDIKCEDSNSIFPWNDITINIRKIKPSKSNSKLKLTSNPINCPFNIIITKYNKNKNEISHYNYTFNITIKQLKKIDKKINNLICGKKGFCYFDSVSYKPVGLPIINEFDIYGINEIENYLQKLFHAIPLFCEFWFYQQLNLKNSLSLWLQNRGREIIKYMTNAPIFSIDYTTKTMILTQCLYKIRKLNKNKTNEYKKMLLINGFINEIIDHETITKYIYKMIYLYFDDNFLEFLFKQQTVGDCLCIMNQKFNDTNNLSIYSSVILINGTVTGKDIKAYDTILMDSDSKIECDNLTATNIIIDKQSKLICKRINSKQLMKLNNKSKIMSSFITAGDVIIDGESKIESINDKNNLICICGMKLVPMKAMNCYGGDDVICHACNKKINETKTVFHCISGKNFLKHTDGYDICENCGDNSKLNFDKNVINDFGMVKVRDKLIIKNKSNLCHNIVEAQDIQIIDA